MFMSRNEKRLLKVLTEQVNALTQAVQYPTLYEKIHNRIFLNGNVISHSDNGKSLKERLNMCDLDAHERINALCEELGYTVECEPERYVVRKKKKAQANR